MIAAIRYAREHNIPYLGLCYGLQLAVVEYARNVAGSPRLLPKSSTRIPSGRSSASKTPSKRAR